MGDLSPLSLTTLPCCYWVLKQRPNTRLTRWVLELQEFAFTVERRKKNYNTAPDNLCQALHDINALNNLSSNCATMLSDKRDRGKDLPISDDQILSGQQDDLIQCLYQS